MTGGYCLSTFMLLVQCSRSNHINSCIDSYLQSRMMDWIYLFVMWMCRLSVCLVNGQWSNLVNFVILCSILIFLLSCLSNSTKTCIIVQGIKYNENHEIQEYMYFTYKKLKEYKVIYFEYFNVWMIKYSPLVKIRLILLS